MTMYTLPGEAKKLYSLRDRRECYLVIVFVNFVKFQDIVVINLLHDVNFSLEQLDVFLDQSEYIARHSDK